MKVIQMRIQSTLLVTLDNSIEKRFNLKIFQMLSSLVFSLKKIE
jgi:hypothetical protein